MTTDIYKFAAQNKLVFSSIRGNLSVDQLFDLPLTSRAGFDLDTVAKNINAELKSESEESFVNTSSNPRKKTLEVALEIVKDVIATKQEANAALLARQQRAEERKKILDAIGAKKDQQLSQASLEELEKKLSELDA